MNYSITVYSNPLTIKFIIPTVKTFPSFFAAAKEQELVKQSK